MITGKNRFWVHEKFSFLKEVMVIGSYLLFYSLHAHSQREQGLPFITNYYAKDYQASPQNWAIIEDDRGVMYFGNSRCLLEYDGVKWRNITSGVNSIVRSLSKDKNGQIYYGSYGSFGYLAPDSLGQTQLHSLLKFVPPAYQNFNDVWTVYATGQEIYFQSRERIFRFRKINTGATENWDVKVWNSPNTNKFMYAFYLDNTYYVHQQGAGLLKMVNDSLVIIPGSEFMGNERVQVMLPYTPPDAKSGEKQYLLGAFYSGLYLYNGTAFTHFATETDSLIKNNTLYKGILLQDGSYALATAGKGIIIINKQGKRLQQLNREVGLQDESVYAIYTDRNGTLWIALDNGISRVESASPFTHFSIQSGITTATISINRFKGTLFTGTTNGLLRFNSNTAKFDQVKGIPTNQVFSLTPDSNTLLISTDGLFYIRDNKTGIFKKSVAGDLLISALAIYKKNPDILFTGVAGGITIFKKTGNKILKEEKTTSDWVYAGNIPGIFEDVWSYAEDIDGSMWAGTQQGVLRLSDFMDASGNPAPAKTHIERFGSAEGLSEGSIHVSSVNDKVFFVSDKSVFRFDYTNRRFIADTTFGPMGFGNDPNQYVMTTDWKGRVWLNFGMETALAFPKPGGGYRVEKTPFLPLADQVISNIFPEPNGIIWFAATDGLTRYDENLKKDYNESFKTFLNKVIAGKQALSTIPSGNQPASLPYKQNTLRFEYAAPFFEQEKKTKYQTWLEGFEPDWSGWDYNTYKEYTNLPGGKYHFHVRAMNIYQKVSDEAVYDFAVKPPWYLSWWAFLLYGIAVIALIYLVVRYRTRQLHEKHRELEKIVSERTAELSQRVEELAVINSVQEALVSALDMQAIYDLVGNRIRDVFNAQAVIIANLDQETGLEHFKFTIENGMRFYPEARPFDKLRQHLIETRQKIVINNTKEAFAWFGMEALPGTKPMKSGVFVPLAISDKITSYVSLQNVDKENAFSESDVRLLETLANSMSVALENARLFDETQRLFKAEQQRAAELAIINSVQEGLAAKLDMQAIYDLVGDKIRDVFDAQGVSITYYDRSTNFLNQPYYLFQGKRIFEKGFDLGKGLTSHIIHTGQPLLINEKAIERYKELGAVFASAESEDAAKSWLGVPLISGSKVTGVIKLENYEREFAYSESDVSLLQTLANSMSVALENAHLFDETTRLLKETEQRTAELAVINSVQEGLAKELDMQAIYDLVGNKIRDLFDAQAVIIATFNHENGTEHFKYAIEDGKRFYHEPRPYDKLRKHLIQTRQKIVINKNYSEAYSEFGLKVLPGTKMTKSGVFFPLFIGDKVNSYISLQNMDRENAFSESDIRLLETLSNSMSVALENARLFDETNRLLKETEQRTAELGVINSVQQALAKELDMQAIYDLVGERIRDLFDAQVVAIATFDHEAGTEHFKYIIEKGNRYYPEPRPFDKLRRHLIETRRKILINNDFIEAYNKFGMKAVSGTELPKSALFVPLIIGDKITSYVTLQNIDRENVFSDSDVRLLETLANSMSVALENARLFDETNRLLKETEQRTAELAVINSVQEGLVREMDMQGIYDLVGDRVQKLFSAQAVIIASFDLANKTEHFNYLFENGEKYKASSRPINEMRQMLIDRRHTLYIETEEKARVEYGITAIGDTKMPKSLLFVPLLSGNDIRGYVSLQNIDKENAFSSSDIRLLETLANSMSVALENARLFDETTRLLKETEQRTAELGVINSVQDGLSRELDMQSIYDLVGDKIRDLFDAQVVIIATLDQEAEVEHFRYTIEMGKRYYPEARPLDKLRYHLIEKREKVVINKNAHDAFARFGMELIPGTEDPKSAIYVPLTIGDKVRSYISLQNINIENAFSEPDIRLLETLASSMSVALENARLFDETNRLLKETEQRKAELAVINSVQEGLVREMDLQAIYDLMGNRLCEMFNTQTVLIRTFDLEAGTESWRYAIERGERLYSKPRPLIWANKELVKTKKYILINENYFETARQHGGSGVSKGLPPKSALFVPLVVGDYVRGSISLQNVEIENAFSESDVRLLTTLANSMSVALENARLFEETKLLLGETEKGKKNVELLSEIGKKITASLDFETIFYKLYEHINQLADATIFGVGIYNPEKQQIEYKFAIEKGKRYQPYTRDTTDKNQLPVWCIENRLPIFINDLPNEYSRYISKYEVRQILLEDGTVSQDPLSLIYLPLIVKDRVLGIITIQSFQKNAYTEYHLNLLQNLATYTSIALDNASAYRQLNEREQEIGQRAAELFTVNSISRAMASQLNPDELIKLVGDQMRDLFRANIVYVAMLDYKSDIISFPYQYGDELAPMKLGEGLTSRILQTGKPLLINKDVKQQTDKLGLQRIGVPAASYLGVPISVGDEIIGVLSIQSTEAENRFNENDQRLLSTIATSVGVALRKAKLFEEVQHAKMEAETARKIAEKANEAKSAFLSTVSHELRTPLTSVLGFAKIIRKRLEEKIFPLTDKSDTKTGKTIQQVSDNLGVVISEGERLTTLINDVLDLAKIEAGKMEWNFENVFIQDIAERAIAATTSLFENKNLVLEKNIQNDLPQIKGDHDKLIQVMVNLISNAVKFTPEGTVTCNVYRKDNEIIAGISDTGIGISPEDHIAVFEQFKQVGGDTLTDKPKGTGLGLPICKEIIEHHGGRIWLESEAGKGSTFFFALPLVKTDAIKPLHLDDLVRQLKEQMAQSRLNIKGKDTTILVVDDEDSIRSLLKQELGEAGYNIEEAGNGKEALAKIRINRPDLIILDIMMPEMNGFDVAAILKNDPQTMDIPIIVLSIVQDKARGFRIGVDRYLTKPIDTTQLFAEVGTLLDQGKSKKKVMVVDEDSAAVKTLTDVLQAKGYVVVESDGRELVEKAISTQPDIIILNSVLSGKQEIVQSLRFEKGLENVLFLIYQ